MHHVIFDIDGTLVESYEIDSKCYIEAVKDVTGLTISTDWSKYQHVTDAGILNEALLSEGYQNSQEIEAQVKRLFLEKLKASLASQPIKEVAGASEFLKLLQSMGVFISFATGGWRESAILKLEAAGINHSSFPLVSSNDHYSRVEIMKLAAEAGGHRHPCTYFGDGEWDKDACSHLGFNFVLVGSKFTYTPSIANFQLAQSALACIGYLSKK